MHVAVGRGEHRDADFHQDHIDEEGPHQGDEGRDAQAER